MSVVHELALMESVVETVLERVGERRVLSIRLEIGELSGVSIDAMRFSFDVCASNTPLSESTLEIISIAGAAYCRTCGREEAMSQFGAPCSCGSIDRDVIRGGELQLKHVEVA